MSLKKILAQKIKNPKNKRWIETSYVVTENTAGNDPIIYMHGKLADNNIIEGRNIQENAIATSHIASLAVNANKLANNAVTSPKILNKAVTKEKINWSTIFTATKLADNTYKITIGQ